MGDNSGNVVSFTSAAPAMIATAHRVVSGQNNLYLSVQPISSTSTPDTVTVSVNKDYTTQTAFVNELNTQITANVALQTVLAVVNGYVRFSVVAATATVAEHIRLSSFLVNVNCFHKVVRTLSGCWVEILTQQPVRLHFNPVHPGRQRRQCRCPSTTQHHHQRKCHAVCTSTYLTSSRTLTWVVLKLRCFDAYRCPADIGTVQTYEPQQRPMA